MDLFAIDSDSESYSGTSDSEDQEECEFTYSDHAQSILSSLDESIGKIDNFLTFERGFLHGDIVCPVSDPSGQLGRVVGVSMFVDLETSSGDIIKDVNSKKISRVRSFISGDCVVMGPWIGRVIRAFDLVTVLFSDGAKCEMLLRDSEALKPIPPILFEDAPYFYYPGQRVRIAEPSVYQSATWLCGSWRPGRDDGVVSHVDVGMVHVNWITSVTNVWGDKSSSPPNIQDPKKLTLLSCFPYANWQLGDWCALKADDHGCLWMDSGKSYIVSEAWKCDSPGHMHLENCSSGYSQTYVVSKTKSTVDILWQNGSISLGLEPQTLVPVSTLGDYDFWPGQFVLEKLAVEDSSRCQRTGIVRDVDALERTVNVLWISPAGSDTVRSDPTAETVSAYELVEHPDFSFCTGEVVIRSAVNIEKSEADLTNGSLASREPLATHSDFLSCIGNVLGYKDDGIEVQWANGVISKVQHFEIIGLDKLLDSSLESMHEENTTGDSVDVDEQEEMHRDNANIALESADCTGSLCKATAFLFPKTAFDFLTNVAASLFGTHGSPSPSSVVIDPPYQIIKMAQMQTSADELPEEKQVVELVTKLEKPNLTSEDNISKRFDVVTDCSDHHFVKESGHESVTRSWVKKVQQEWTILQNDLPDGIHVRVFEERMDLLRACIVGAAGTPYHDNLFFFDIFFPPDYPHEPPSVHYHSGGLRLNPNLYESGKVCLSLLKTWTGTGNEVWNPENSTVLQLLLSLQALVLNEKPYFNEAGYDKFLGKADGERNSITYNENAFLLSCKSMMYVLHKPPKHFEKLVKEHFACRARRILDACEAYLGGDLVGHAHDKAYISEDGSKNCSTGFKIMLGKLLPKLVAAFSEVGIISGQSYLCAGSSSFDDPDVVEVSPAAAAAGGWASGHNKRKRSQVVPHEVIEIDDDDPDGVMIVGDKTSVDKNKQTVVYPMDWAKHGKSSLVHEIPGPSTYASKYANPWVDLKMFQDDAVNNYSDDYPYEGFDEDYAYDEDEYEDDGYDASLVESEYNYSLSSKFDNLDIPPGVEPSLPWMQKTEIANKSKPTKIMDAKIEEKYKAFKQFDTVFDHSDHYYSKPELRKVQVVKKPSKDWAKRIQHEWKVLKKDLPDTIFVRAYEDRMDLLRAVIMGPAGTPYHDGLFFFDIYFPPQYPNVPPMVNYRAGGLRLNPNLYACGKVCLSLLNTWTGSGCEKWNPSNSTMLQVLVSIQALVLNAKPYFNEPGYAMHANTAHGEKKSLTYNEDTFLLSCRTMLYSLRNPPKNFEDFVAGHFRKYGHNILVACRAYLEGAQVGCLAGDGVQDVDEGDKSCSVRFKQSLKRLFEELLMEFTVKGADCDKFLSEKARPGPSTAAADTTLRL